MKRKPLLFCLLCLLLSAAALLLCGCSDSQEGEAEGQVSAAYDDVLRISTDNAVESVDPAHLYSPTEIAIGKLVYQGVVAMDADGEIVAALARNWTVSEDGRTYTFHLHSGATFHNGNAVTAYDVKYSWERMLRQNSPSSYIFASVQGYDRIRSGNSTTLSGVEVLDDRTLTVTLSESDDQFLANLSLPAASVLNGEEITSQGDDFARPSDDRTAYALPSGTGPYRLTEWLTGESVVLGLYDDYYDADFEPVARRLEFYIGLERDMAVSRLIGGRLDVVTGLTPALISTDLERSGAIIRREPSRDFYFLVFNIFREPFNSAALREAAAASIDVEAILNEALGGSALAPESFVDYFYEQNQSEVSVTTDPAHAQEILAQAGYGISEENPVLASFQLDCGPSALEVAIAQICADSLRDLGFEVEVVSHSYRELRNLVRTGNTTVYLGSFTDDGGGLNSFFAQTVDHRRQNVIPYGNWTSDMLNGYEAYGGGERYLFDQAAQLLESSNVIRFLAYRDLYWAEMP